MNSPPDQQGVNDEVAKFIQLDYFHDVGIEEVTSPVDLDDERVFFAVDSGARTFEWFTYDDPGTFNYISNFPSSQFPQGATFDKEQKMWVCDTTGNIWYKEDPMSEDITSVGSAGTGELTGLAYHEGNGKMYGCSASTFYEIDMGTGKATSIGSIGAGGLVISIDCDQDGKMYCYDLAFTNSKLYEIDIGTGKGTEIGNIGFSANFGQDMAYDWKEEEMLATVFDYGLWGAYLRYVDLETGEFTDIDQCEPLQVTCFAIPGGGITLDTYIAPGKKDIIAIAKNYGTFPEMNLNATADLYEFISNCENATHLQHYTDDTVNLPTPLGGEDPMDFGDYTFVDEGFYGLMVFLTDDNDDNLGNNVFAYGIGVDDTEPVSAHSLDPPNPDGLNDWYVSDLEVTLMATDPILKPEECGRAGSGVNRIEYEINGAPGSVPGNEGTFTITVAHDGIVDVEYWAVDNVENAEARNSFTIKMDRTIPNIDLIYEWRDGPSPPGPPWWFDFIANATDDTSVMERVEFRLNAELQKIITGPGPEYIFSLLYVPPPRAIWTATAFDFAGLENSDVVEDPEFTANLKSGSSSSEFGKTISIPQRI
jgi:hypothetical protein